MLAAGRGRARRLPGSPSARRSLRSCGDSTEAAQPGNGCCGAQAMVCLEPAVAGSGPVELAPGGTWTGAQVLTLADAASAL
jgi:hypothetical protein